jgi:hypothetical protein
MLRSTLVSLPTYDIVDLDIPLQQILLAGNYFSINTDITNMCSEEIPGEHRTKANTVVRLAQIERAMSDIDVVVNFARHGFRPATFREFLLIGAQHCDLQREESIITFDPRWSVTPMLYEYKGLRCIGRASFDFGWFRTYRYAVVPIELENSPKHPSLLFC